MKQLVQSTRSGELSFLDIPTPRPDATEVLVRTTRSLISSGTERAVRELASSSLLDKARARPDLVRQVIKRAKNDGLKATYKAVNARLDGVMPLGYSAAGVVMEVGEAVAGVRVGQRVATGGAGHGEMQIVPGNLVVPIPDGVSDDDAAFATVGSIALHALRMLELTAGSCVCVIGLGLIGQIAARLALASGFRVCGIDPNLAAVKLAKESGVFALLESGEDTSRAILEWSRDRGVDGTLVTAATKSSDPVLRATTIARDRSEIVVVGDVGLELDRRPFYDKELSVRFARSYGPGRYERAYEEWAVDYPAGQVRWTEGRNLEAVLDLIGEGQVSVSNLVTDRFPFSDAPAAYERLSKGGIGAIGVLLEYSNVPSLVPITQRRVRSKKTGTGIGLFGAGNFASGVLLPAFKAAGFTEFVGVCTPSGVSASSLAGKEGFQNVFTDPDDLLANDAINIVIIASSHESHADLVLRSLRAGKDVFCEKPLALTLEDLAEIEATWRDSGQRLFVGFNRRYSPAVQSVQQTFGPTGSPLIIAYMVNAGKVDKKHWYHDRRQGGRLIGEVCHFIDTSAAIAQSNILEIAAVPGGLFSESALVEDIALVIRFENGCLGSICYSAGGHPATPKESISVLGRGHTMRIDDFRSLELDGKALQSKGQDKGHQAEVAVFAHGKWDTDQMIHSMRATLKAATFQHSFVLRDLP